MSAPIAPLVEHINYFDDLTKSTKLLFRRPMKTTDQLAEKFTMTRLDQTIAGRELMKTLPFISLNEIALLKPDQIVQYVNDKHSSWKEVLPKMPTLYSNEYPDGSVLWSQTKDPDSKQMITHYAAPIEIPKLKTPDKLPVPRAIFLDVMTRAVECGIE